MNTKEDLRRYYLDIRENLKSEHVEKLSKKITDSFISLPELKKSFNIMVYISHRNEVRTEGIIKYLLSNDKRIYVPYCIVEKNEIKIARIFNLDEDLAVGAYGILEPREKLRKDLVDDIMDIVLVPGVAFSKDGYRIGYGGGYYDRFLENSTTKTLNIGLCFDKLLVDSLPKETHDLPVDKIITEKRIIDCG